MPIPIDNKNFHNFDDAVKHLQKKGYSKESATRIVGSIEKHVKGASQFGSIPELSTSKDGKHYAKFFLLNANINSRDWNVTPESIPLYIASFKGMPYVSEPQLEHFGAEHMSIPQVFKEQEQYRAGTIVDVKYSAEKQEAYAVVEIHDEAVWKDLNNGEAIYVSPAVGGSGYEDPDTGGVTFTKWYGIHLARVAHPAYGVHHASIKETCTGEGDYCVNHLMATASASIPEIARKAVQNNSYVDCMCTASQMSLPSQQMKQTSSAVNGNGGELEQAPGSGLTQTGLPTNNEGHPAPGHMQLAAEMVKMAKMLNDFGNPDRRNKNVNPMTGDGMTTDKESKPTGKPGRQEPEDDDETDDGDGKGDKTTVKTSALAAELQLLKSKVAAMVEKEKQAIASDIISMEKDAGLLTASEENGRLEALMANGKETLEAHIANFTPYYNKLMEYKSKVPGSFDTASAGARVIKTPGVASEAQRTGIVTMDDAREAGLFSE